MNTILKTFNQYEIDLINGYSHGTQLQLPNHNLYHTIPSVIIYLILSYFCHPESFNEDEWQPLQGVELSDDKTKATSCYKVGVRGARSVYGKRCIPFDSQCIYKWTFKCSNIKNYGKQVAIGIHSFTFAQPILNDNFHCGRKHTFYTFSNFWALDDNGYLYSKSLWENDISAQWRWWGKADCTQEHAYDCSWKNGDIIAMILDTKYKTLSYCKNGKNCGIAFDKMELYMDTYMAVSMNKKHISVELLSFSVKRHE